MAELRKYGAATTIPFPLIDRGTADFESTPVTFQSSDARISKDFGAFTNANTTPVHEGEGIYSLALTSTEMTAATVIVTIKDITATKLWEDQGLIIETYGDASAEHAFDLDEANPAVAGIVAGAAVAGVLSTTQMTTDLTEDTDSHYIDRTLVWTSGVLDGQAASVQSYTANSKMMTYSTRTDAPGAADTFVVV